MLNNSSHNINEVEYSVGLFAESSPDKKNRWIQNSIISLSLSISEPHGIYAVVREESVDTQSSNKIDDNKQVYLTEEETAEFLLWRKAYNQAFWDYEGWSEKKDE